MSLEKENNSLAHSLIQKSVKQAIEAEEKLLLGKELKLAKKHVKRLSGGGVTGKLHKRYIHHIS